MNQDAFFTGKERKASHWHEKDNPVLKPSHFVQIFFKAFPDFCGKQRTQGDSLPVFTIPVLSRMWFSTCLINSLIAYATVTKLVNITILGPFLKSLFYTFRRQSKTQFSVRKLVFSNSSSQYYVEAINKINNWRENKTKVLFLQEERKLHWWKGRLIIEQQRAAI